jgi:hypothetical protein
VTLKEYYDKLGWTISKYVPEYNTYSGSTHEAYLSLLFNKGVFKDIPKMNLLDEKVRIGDEIAVILKDEVELRTEGWTEGLTKLLKKGDSPFRIGPKKKSLLGGIHAARVGITRQFEPLVSIGGYRFTEGELKCVINTNNDSLVKLPKMKATEYGVFTYKPGGNLKLPTQTYNQEMITDLVDFLRQIGAI